MDPRRTARTVIDPKVRQVGFFTPAAAPLQQAQSAPVVAEGGGLPSPPLSDISVGSNSLSPVMIPPPRHLSAPVSVPVPSSPLRRDSLTAFPVGSYNPSESLPGTSPLPSPSSRMDGSEYSEDVTWAGKGATGRVASSFPGSGGEMLVTNPGTNNLQPKSSLTTASVVKMPAGLTGNDVDSRVPASLKVTSCFFFFLMSLPFFSHHAKNYQKLLFSHSVI